MVLAARQASAWLTWAAYIPMAEARGFTPRFGNGRFHSLRLRILNSVPTLW
jgi:hypothetical protein